MTSGALIHVNNVSLEQLTYHDTPVVTFQQIADVHGIPIQNIYRSFKRHEERFTKGKHFYRIENKEEYLEYNDSFRTNYLFTEKGYLLLTKPMRDQKSWEVQERMIDDYFSLKTIALAGHDDLAAIQETLVKLAQIRNAQKIMEAHQQAMEQAQREQDRRLLEQSQRISEATALAQQAFQAQIYTTLRQFRYVNSLERQLTDEQLARFSRHLSAYCRERGIPVSKEGVADRSWGVENRYPTSVIQELLPQWLARNEAQDAFSPTLDDA